MVPGRDGLGTLHERARLPIPPVQARPQLSREQKVNRIVHSLSVRSFQHSEPIVRRHQSTHLPQFIGRIGIRKVALKAGLKLCVGENRAEHASLL